MRALLAISMLMSCASGWARDQVWLIGSGPDVYSTEAQIEANFIWAREVFAALPGERRIHAFFADGDAGWPDVTAWRKPPEDAASLQPLARVYDTFYANGYRYRDNRAGDLAGPASADHLNPRLRSALASLAPGDKALLYFVGHGAQGEAQAGGNRLSLWGHSRLTVADMQSHVSGLAPDTSLRFVMTQCYSGGFAEVIYPDARRAAEAISGRVCGFMSVAADAPAEGCSANLDSGNYRGYSTYFLAALSGASRDGEPLGTELGIDRDGDGTVSLLEAHRYTLLAARSTDQPRSTSEQYLLDWAPWYLKLRPVAPRSGNPYRPLAQRLAAELEIDLDAGSLSRRLYQRRTPLQNRRDELEAEQEGLSDIVARARRSIQHALEQRWPAARLGPTRAYADFLVNDSDAAQAFIREHPLYGPLVEEQDRYWSLDRARLELQREIARGERLAHLQRLTRLWDAFHAWADDEERDAYARLVACEGQPP